MNGQDCGDGVFAGPKTSCPFAKNVRDGYFAVPGDSVEIDVFSPVTGQTYTMACVRIGDRVTCRGGNNAVVRFAAKEVGTRHLRASPAIVAHWRKRPPHKPGSRGSPAR